MLKLNFYIFLKILGNYLLSKTIELYLVVDLKYLLCLLVGKDNAIRAEDEYSIKKLLKNALIFTKLLGFAIGFEKLAHFKVILSGGLHENKEG
jgi:hypothetical protein